MRPHPPAPPDPTRRSLEDDFDWPPDDDDLSIHDLEGEPWSHLQAVSNEAFAHRHGEPPPRRRVSRGPRLQLAVVVGMSAVLAVAAVWALRESLHAPMTLLAGDVVPPMSTVVAAPAEDRPPNVTIVATYQAGSGPSAAEPPIPSAPAADPGVLPPIAGLEEPRPVAATSTDVPSIGGGPAIDEAAVALAPAVLIADAVAAPAAPPTAPWSARADEDIRDLLRRYEAAYDRRDVATAATLWPTLDQRALSRAFASLDRQDVSFERCDIDASDARGSAVCVGTVRYVPRVGRGVEKEGRITWTFDLTRSGEAWRIARLNAR